MSAEAITAIGTGVGILLSALGAMIMRSVAKRSEQDQTGVQALGEALDTWQALAERADRKADQALSENVKLRAEQERARDQARRQSKQLSTLRRIVNTYAEWGRHLVDNWEELRQHESPPRLPQVEDID